jgi:hypothetical protein
MFPVHFSPILESLKFTIKHQAMKTYGEQSIATPFLTSALDASCFTPTESTLGTQWIGGCAGPRVGVDTVEKRNILPLPRIELRPSSL